MLTLDPSQRISAKDALDAEYFWADPLPCDPKSLPKYESSHEFQTKKKRQQQRQNEEMAKRQKIQHPQQRAQLPLVGQAQAHSQHWAGHNHPMGNPSQALVASGGLNHHEYGKPRGGPGGPNRYPPGGNSNLSVGGYCPDRSTGQGGVGFRHEPYPPQARVPSASGPGGFSSDYGVGPPSFLQNVQYGGSSEVVARGPNVPGNCNQPYSWQQQ